MTNQNTRFRPGHVIVYFIVSSVALIGLIALALDWARVEIARTELQQATDAAARYGVAGLPQGVDAVKARVAVAAAENKVDGQSLLIDTNTDIEFGTWNASTQTFTVSSLATQDSARAIRVTARRAAARGSGVPIFFGRFLGHNTIDIKASAVAGRGQGTDVVLVQDITTSFTAQLPSAVIGDQALLDGMYAGGKGWSRLAIVVHTGWGRILAPLTQVDTNYAYLTSIISSIKIAGSPGMPAPSGTNIASGFDEAIAIYNATGYVEPAGGKAVVLVSDGQPTASASGKHPTLNDTQMLALAVQRADELWARNVHVYVVFSDADNDTVAADRLRSLIRGNGVFVRVSDPTQLPVVLADITKKLPVQLVR